MNAIQLFQEFLSLFCFNNAYANRATMKQNRLTATVMVDSPELERSLKLFAAKRNIKLTVINGRSFMLNFSA